MRKKLVSILGGLAVLAAVLVIAPGCADSSTGNLTIQGSGSSE